MATEDDVRRIALSLPQVAERPWHSTPGWRVKDKSFLRTAAAHEHELPL
jgi:hypothetical protein